MFGDGCPCGWSSPLFCTAVCITMPVLECAADSVIYFPWRIHRYHGAIVSVAVCNTDSMVFVQSEALSERNSTVSYMPGLTEFWSAYYMISLICRLRTCMTHLVCNTIIAAKLNFSPDCITIQEFFVTLPRHSKNSEIWIKQRLSLSALRKADWRPSIRSWQRIATTSAVTLLRQG